MGRRWQAKELTASARKYATIYCSYSGTYYPKLHLKTPTNQGKNQGDFPRGWLGGCFLGALGWQLTCLCLPAAGGHLPSAQMQPKVAEGVAKMEKSGEQENGKTGWEETVT